MSLHRKMLLTLLIVVTALATCAFTPLPSRQFDLQPDPQTAPNAPYFKYARNSIGFVDQVNLQSTSLQIFDQYLYSGYVNFSIVDMSDPTDLRLLDRLRTNYVFGFTMREKRAYLGLQNYGVLSLDTTVQTLSEFSNVKMKDGAYGVALADGFLYAAMGDQGVGIYNENKPTDLPQVGQIKVPGFSNGVTVAGNYAIIANGYYGIRIYDITDKANPREVSAVPMQGFAASVTLDGDTAYVADSFGGLRIMDVSNKSDPREISKVKPTGSVVKVVVKDNYAYLAAREGGLLIYDISDKRAPVMVARHASAGGAWDLAVQGNYIYLADLPAGIRVLYFIPPVRASVSNSGGSMTSNSDNVQYSFDSGTFSSDSYITHQPLYHTSVYENSVYQPKVGPFFQVLAVDERGNPVKPSKPFSISIPYSDTGIDPQREYALGLYYWDGAKWIKVQNTSVDTAKNMIYATVDKFAIYGVFLDKTLPPLQTP